MVANLSWPQRVTLQWRHGRDSVSNHQHHDCLLNRLFRHRSKKTSKLRVTGLCAGNSPDAGEFSAQMASNAENVSIWWRHHELFCGFLTDDLSVLANPECTNKVLLEHIRQKCAAVLEEQGNGILCNTWCRHQMETFSALLAFCVGNSPVPLVNSPYKGQWRGVLMHLNQQLSKQWRRRWLEMLSCLLWRHCSDLEEL